MAATLVRMPCRNVVIFGGKGPFLATPISDDLVDPALLLSARATGLWGVLYLGVCHYYYGGSVDLRRADILPPDMTGQVASSSCPPAPLLLLRSPTVIGHMPTLSPDQAVAFFYLKRHVTDIFKMQNG